MTASRSFLVIFIMLVMLHCMGCAGESGWANPSVNPNLSKPTAAFTFSPSSPTVGHAVTFTDTSTGSPTSWSWSFGDGGTSTAQNPSHAYLLAGPFTVTLKATNAAGSSSVSHTLSVASPPLAAFTYTPAAPVKAQAVTFKDASTARPTAWSWSFGDGGSSTVENPIHTYSATGSFTVTLTASNVAGSSIVSHTVRVIAAPVAAFTYSPSAPAHGEAVAFTDASTGLPSAWAWSFGDGGTSAAQNPSHTYSAAGVFTVTLKATNAAGSSSVSQTVTVTNAPVAFFTYTPSAPVSAGSVAFTDTSTGTPTAWSWTFGDGSTSALKNPNHIYGSPGTFTATLTAKNANGSTSASRTITVNPEVSASGYDTTLTLSDGAQSTTLAFDGLAMMTGNLDAQSFFPPGKVADYTGFQYLRDTDPDNMGHDTDFLTRVANNVIYILTDDQMTQLVTLASAQLDNVNLYAYERFSLMEAFSRTLDRRYSRRLDGPESRRGQTGFGESLSD